MRSYSFWLIGVVLIDYSFYLCSTSYASVNFSGALVFNYGSMGGLYDSLRCGDITFSLFIFYSLANYSLSFSIFD